MKAHFFDAFPEDYKPIRVSYNVNISNMAFKDVKKDIHWFWKTDLNGSKKKEKPDQKEKVIALNSGENKQ